MPERLAAFVSYTTIQFVWAFIYQPIGHICIQRCGPFRAILISFLPSMEGSSHPRVMLFAKLSGIPISDKDGRQFRPFALTDYFLPIVRSLVRCIAFEQTTLMISSF